MRNMMTGEAFGRWRAAGGVCALGVVGALFAGASYGPVQWLGCALVAGWLNLAALAAGLAAGARLLAGQPPSLRLAAAAALGWGMLALLLYALGLAGGLAPEIIWPVLLAASLLVLGATPAWRAALAELPALWRAAAPEISCRWARTGVLLVLLPAALVLTVPPIAYDAMTYHLALPQQYLNAGRTIALPWNHYSGFPQLVEMLFLAGLALVGPVFSHFIVFSLGCWLLLALWGLARYQRLLSPAAAWLALLIAATMPEIWDGFSVAMIDIPAALFMVLAVAFLFAGRPHELTLAALFTGLAAGCKYTLWWALPLHLLVILLRGRAGKRLKSALWFGAVAVVALAPWPVQNLVLTGNPVYPFGGAWFATPGRDPALQEAYARQGFELFGTPNSPGNLLARPWDMTMQEEKFGAGTIGTLGPLLLLFAPFAFAAGSTRMGGYALYLLAWYLWWSATSQQNRHLVFFFCLLAPLAAAGVRHLWRTRWCRPLLLAVLLAAMGHNLAWSAMKKERFYDAWSWLAGASDETTYMTRHYPGWPIVEKVNCLALDGGSVLFVGHEFAAYVERPAIVAPAYSRDPLERLLLGLDPLPARTPAGLADALRARGVQHLVWSDMGFAFKRGFHHYQLDEEAQRLLDDFRRTQLIQLATIDGVTLYALIEP